MAKQVDARGLSCPQPVILTREAMKVGEFPIHVLVDTGTSRDNVSRVAEKAGLKVTVEERDDGFEVIISR